MRPKSERNKRRDYKRGRGWRRYESWDGQPYHGWHMISYYHKKPVRITANRAVRRYKSFVSNGCAYKKIYDVEYEVW